MAQLFSVKILSRPLDYNLINALTVHVHHLEAEALPLEDVRRRRHAPQVRHDEARRVVISARTRRSPGRLGRRAVVSGL